MHRSKCWLLCSPCHFLPSHCSFFVVLLAVSAGACDGCERVILCLLATSGVRPLREGSLKLSAAPLSSACWPPALAEPSWLAGGCGSCFHPAKGWKDGVAVSWCSQSCCTTRVRILLLFTHNVRGVNPNLHDAGKL